MFIPNQFGQLSRKLATNVSGETQYGRPQRVQCAVARLGAGSQKTSVRSDSSASRGNASEIVSTAKILFPKLVEPRIGDKFEIHGFTLRVLSALPRFDVAGALDHHECEFEPWSL